MDKGAFDDLVKKLEPYLTPKKRARSDSVTASERVFLALMWLGGGGSFGRLENQTGRGASTIAASVDKVCKGVNDALQDEIRLPTRAEAKASADAFEEHTGMRGHESFRLLALVAGCIGALDGTTYDISSIFVTNSGSNSLVQRVCVLPVTTTKGSHDVTLLRMQFQIRITECTCILRLRSSVPLDE